MAKLRVWCCMCMHEWTAEADFDADAEEWEIAEDDKWCPRCGYGARHAGEEVTDA